MTKKNAKSKALAKKPNTQRKSPLKTVRALLKRVPKYIGILIGVFSFTISMYFVLRPKVVIQSDKNLNRDDPFQTTFLIINRSELSIANVQYSYIPNVEFGGDNAIRETDIGGNPDVFRQNATIQNIPAGKSSTLNRNYIRVRNIHSASLKIKYSYDYMGLTFTDSNYFFCVRGTDNWYQWVPLY